MLDLRSNTDIDIVRKLPENYYLITDTVQATIWCFLIFDTWHNTHTYTNISDQGKLKIYLFVKCFTFSNQSNQTTRVQIEYTNRTKTVRGDAQKINSIFADNGLIRFNFHFPILFLTIYFLRKSIKFDQPPYLFEFLTKKLDTRNNNIL